MPLHSACLATLGLRQSPFEQTPEPRFIYDDSLLESLADVAFQALTQPNAIVILTGVEGVGRSTQLMRLLGMLPDTMTAIAFRARPHTAFETVELTIRHHLRSQISGSTDINTPLPELLTERLGHGPTPVLAIDDAQSLVTAAIEHLLQLRRQVLDQVGHAPALVLVGDQSLAQMKLPALDADDDERVVYLHLRPFNREQVAEYVKFRLQAAGCATPETLLQQAPLDRFHESSHGLPGDLNRMAETWLLDLCRPPELAAVPLMTVAAATPVARAAAPVDSVIVRRSAWWQHRWLIPVVVTGALAAIAVPLLWQRPAHELRTTDDELGIAPVTPPPVIAAPMPPAAPVEPPVEVTPTPVRSAAPATAVAPAAPVEPPAEVTPTPVRSAPATPIAVVTPPVPVEPTVPATSDTAVATPPAASPVVSSPPAPTPTVAVAPVADAPVSPTAPPTAVPVATATPVTAAAPPPVQSPRAMLQSDRTWLMAQNPRHFTIQLIAAETLATARAHVAAYGVQDVRFVATRTRNRDYIVALTGSFANQAAAEQAVNTLPPPLRQQGHWLRTLGSVQELLR